MKEGYSICFNEWALDKEIKNELGLLLIISSLCAEKGYCFASNKYLSQLFDIPEQTISRKIKLLENKNYITIEYKKRGCEIIERNIRLTKLLNDDKQKCVSTINKIVKDNNININNTSNNKYIYMGTYKRIKLTKEQYNKLIDDYGENYIQQIINRLDEYVESNNNKNKYSNYNLVIRKAIRDNWFKIEKLPSWFNQETKTQQASIEEQQEMEEMLKKYR